MQFGSMQRVARQGGQIQQAHRCLPQLMHPNVSTLALNPPCRRCLLQLLLQALAILAISSTIKCTKIYAMCVPRRLPRMLQAQIAS